MWVRSSRPEAALFGWSTAGCSGCLARSPVQLNSSRGVHWKSEVVWIVWWNLTKWQKTTVMSRCSVWSLRSMFTGSRRGRPTVGIGKMHSERRNLKVSLCAGQVWLNWIICQFRLSLDINCVVRIFTYPGVDGGRALSQKPTEVYQIHSVQISSLIHAVALFLDSTRPP